MIEHEFTRLILEIVKKYFPDKTLQIVEKSLLLQYVNLKTRSANRNSKSRGSFANLYAIYVLVEDYIHKGYINRKDYNEYEGARYSDLLTRQRKLPFGSKLQNHALNSRLNEEFKKFFPNEEYVPILRDLSTYRYWINENLLLVENENVAKPIIEIIDLYISTKRNSFEEFIHTCERFKVIAKEGDDIVSDFITNLIAPHSDARIFEIVSYAILRYFYFNQECYFGFNPDELIKENLRLYKTGRTNSNDGGIDFVMKPLGIFFQVTETTDFKKYFLDIDKIERYPISFVIKSEEDIKNLTEIIENGATKLYGIKSIVRSYMECIEEIINIPELISRFNTAKENGYLRNILEEIIVQSKVEFNYEDLGNEDEIDSDE